MATKVWVGGDGSAPSAWDEAANWSPSGVPGAGADVVIPATAEYGIDGYNASSTALNSFKIQTGYAETIGDSTTNLHIALTGQPDREVVLAGTAQQFLDIDGAARITVIEAASAQAQNDYGCNIVGEANDAIYVQCTSAGNSVGIAGRPGTSCAVDAIAISGGAVTIGEGVVDSDSDTDPDIHSLQMSGGLVECSGTVNAMTVEGGTLEYAGGDCETVRGNSGLIRWASDADIQALYVEGGATVDFDYDLGVKAIAAAYVSAGATIIDTLRGVVWTNGIQLNGTTLAAVNLDLGTSYQVDISEIA